MSFKPVRVKPAMGGRLMTGVSADNAGLFHYTIKRDFRRDKDGEQRAEGFDLFVPNPATPDQPAVLEQINLITMVRRPNGQTAVVVGTKTKLFRYFGLDTGDYFSGNGTADEYFQSAATYFQDNPGVWVQIGSGFSPNGKRWEVENINGYLVLNNAVDLPMTYRLEELSVKPIYELREQGIASVGTITAHDGILICADIRQIRDEKFTEIMTPLAAAVQGSVTGVTATGVLASVNSGVGGVEGNIITAASSAFNGGNGFTGLVGSAIRMANGLKRNIVSVESPTSATLDGAADLAEPAQPFYLLSATDNQMDQTCAALFPAQTPGDCIGLHLYWDSGEVREIVGVSGGKFVLDADAPIPLGNVSLENPLAYAAFTDDGYIDRFQHRLTQSLPEQPRRFGAIVPCTVDPTSNFVKLKYPVRSLENGMDVLILSAGVGGGNLTATISYAMGNQILVESAAVTEAARLIQAEIDSAEADEAAAQVTVESTQSTLDAAIDAKALADTASDDAAAASDADPTDDDLKQKATDAKQAATDASAKVDTARANLTAAQKALTDAQAATAKAKEALQPIDAYLQAADTVNSITGKYDDLEGDGSGIVRMLTLRTKLIVYKETSIFVGTFTGNSDSPWAFDELEIPEGTALYYPNTLISVGGMFHIFAGQSAFFRFDLVNQVPMEMPEFQLCQDVLFDQASTDKSDEIFAADNALTHEIFIYFPSDSDDKALRYDYRFGTVSTTSAGATAAATVLRPELNGRSTTLEDWFVMGGDNGLVLRYGLLATKPVKSGAIKATKASGSNEVNATADIFTSRMIGRSIITQTGKVFAITGCTNARKVTVLGDGEFTGETFTVDPAIYHRNGEDYDSVLQSGMEPFGAPNSDKDMDEYVLFLASNSNSAEIQIAFRGGVNASQASDLLTTTIPSPQVQNMVPLIVSRNYLGDRITVSGINNPVKITERLFNIRGVDSRGFSRQPA